MFCKVWEKTPHIFGKSFCRHDLQKVVLVFDKVFFFMKRDVFSLNYITFFNEIKSAIKDHTIPIDIMC